VLTEAGAVFTGPGICMHPKRKTLPGRIAAVAAIPFEGQLEPAEGMKVIELAAVVRSSAFCTGPMSNFPSLARADDSLAKGERPRPKTVLTTAFCAAWSTS